MSLFTEELYNWLKTLPFACRVAYQADFALPLLEIANTEGPVLKIIPVTLSHWEKSGSHVLLNRLTKLLHSIRNEGLTAVTIWEDYWLGRKSIVKSRLAAMLGISAKIPGRLTQVRRIDNAVTDGFLEANHLNGNVTSKFRYGLFLPARYFRVLPEGFAFDASAEEMLVAVATFGNARIFEQDNAPFRSHELIRFASLAGTNIVGALDKLLHAFIREKSPDDIMTYADVEWSDGRSYRKLGFEERGIMPPREAYVRIGDMRRVRVKVTQPVLQTPVEYLTVYNLGSIKYVRTVKPVEFHA